MRTHLLLENFDLLFLLSSLLCRHNSCKVKSALSATRKKIAANLEVNSINKHSEALKSPEGILLEIKQIMATKGQLKPSEKVNKALGRAKIRKSLEIVENCSCVA